jgi:hypothetical protein
MDDTQYRIALQKLGLNQSSGARWLGISLSQSQNYARRVTPVPQPIARFLRLVINLKLTAEEAAKLMKE